MVVDQERKLDEVETQLFYDMHLMMLNNGKERNEKEWAKLFFDAGFTYYKITHKLGVRSMIELFLFKRLQPVVVVVIRMRR
ncbi:hypothetical protein Leryth_012293 [Lithospermum erythrorhizon]|nr:hypothetical protein Leryth_012293 [Lithospermum erythrorhizon]